MSVLPVARALELLVKPARRADEAGQKADWRNSLLGGFARMHQVSSW